MAFCHFLSAKRVEFNARSISFADLQLQNGHNAQTANIPSSEGRGRRWEWRTEEGRKGRGTEGMGKDRRARKRGWRNESRGRKVKEGTGKRMRTEEREGTEAIGGSSLFVINKNKETNLGQ